MRDVMEEARTAGEEQGEVEVHVHGCWERLDARCFKARVED